MASKYSGAFFFIPDGRWLTAATVLSDGTLTDRHGITLEPIDLETEVFTVRAVASAVINAGKRTRLDLVNSVGLDLPAEIGKGRNTLRRIIELRAGERAAQIIEAYVARMESDEAIAA